MPIQPRQPIAVNSGSLLIYGATTDNVTQDPSAQFAKKIE